MKVALSTLMIQRGKTGVAQYVFNLAKGILQFEPSIKLHLLVLEEDRPLFEFARERELCRSIGEDRPKTSSGTKAIYLSGSKKTESMYFMSPAIAGCWPIHPARR
jgi:hypothetical protein